MSEPQRDIVYVLHWGDLASTIRMLAVAPTLRAVHKRDRIVLLTRPDFESFLKPNLCKILVPVAYSFYIFIVKKLEKMIAF